MIAEPVLFRDLAYVFLPAVLGGALARLAHQPLILGYVFGGLLVSPLTPGPSVTDVHTFQAFAEIGVVLLMCSLGIEFSLKDLMGVKWIALVGAPLGMALSIGLTLTTGAVLGWSPLQGAVVGMVICVASTMVLARLLLDRGELHTRHGRVMIGISLVEDLVVVVLIVLIPALGALQGERLVAIVKALLTAAVILGPFFYLTRRILPPILARVARTRSDELFLLVTLAIGLGAAAITQAAGLSLALGAFLAGLLINESDYAHEMLARAARRVTGDGPDQRRARPARRAVARAAASRGPGNVGSAIGRGARRPRRRVRVRPCRERDRRGPGDVRRPLRRDRDRPRHRQEPPRPEGARRLRRRRPAGHTRRGPGRSRGPRHPRGARKRARAPRRQPHPRVQSHRTDPGPRERSGVARPTHGGGRRGGDPAGAGGRVDPDPPRARAAVPAAGAGPRLLEQLSRGHGERRAGSERSAGGRRAASDERHAARSEERRVGK